MKIDNARGVAGLGKGARAWDERWARFALGLGKRGVDPARRQFCRGWVLGFLGFIKPKGFAEAGREDVRSFLAKLAGEGKPGWQVAQAEMALRVMFEEVDPRKWASPWPEGMMPEMREGLALDTAAGVPSGPVGDASRFAGRTDQGGLPERYEGFMDQVREALRVER